MLDRIEAITGIRPVFYELDVCDKQALRKVFEKNRLMLQFILQVIKLSENPCKKPVMYYKNNMSTLALVEVMSEFNVKRLSFLQVRLYMELTISHPN